MGTVAGLLLFYGHGREIFGEFVASVEPDLRAGATTPLCKVMNSLGSDKGLSRHNYTCLYDRLFREYLDAPDRVFELGVGTGFSDVPSNMGPNAVPGASLRGWREYFPTASICGADIDRRVLFQSDRIQTLYVDQTDLASVMSLWAHLPQPFDLIVDDGLHEFGANQNFLFGSKHRLKRNGLYIIEDIVMSAENILAYDRMLNSCVMSGFMYRLPHPTNTYDNAIAVLCGPQWTRGGKA
jgi:hypothetical protein